MNSRSLSLILAMLAVARTTSFAGQQPRLPEELAVTRSIVTQERDELQVSPLFRFFRLTDEKRTTEGADLEYGLTDRLELDTEVPYVWSNPFDDSAVNGIGDVEVALRYGVIDYRTQAFGLTAGLGFSTPTGNRLKDLGEGRLGVEPFFTASQRIGPVNAQLNVGWHRAVTNAGDEPKNEYEYNVALLYPIRQCFVVLEGNGETTSQNTKYYVTPELIWKPSKQLELFVAVPIAVTHAAGDYGVVVGVTLEIENVFHRGAHED
jgi:hypothetical protein